MALRLVDLHHRYGGVQALRGVSLHVRRGDCYGFIGHNGAGKTTAMRAALGLLRPTSGRVIVDGFDAARHPAEARARMGGLIETPSFHGEVSAKENLVRLARLAGMPRAAARSEAERVLSRVGLSGVAGRRAGGFSAGMRQRLGIAQAMLGAPPILILDEPTNGLDPEGIRDVRELFRALVRDDGATLLLSSHRLAELEGLCNRVAVLREGELVVEDELERLLTSAGDVQRVRAEDGGRALQVLREAGFEAVDDAGNTGDIEVRLGGRAPREISAALHAGGVALTGLSAKHPNLEEIVLAAGERPRVRGDDGASDASADGAPEPKRVPPASVWRAARYELARLRGPRSLALLALPPVAAILAQLARWQDARADRAAIEAGELFGATQVTGFEAVGLGLKVGLPILAILLAGFASQSLAGELGRGTLRNAVLRPLTRRALLAGKALAHAIVALGAYALLLGGAAAGAAWFFDYGDVVETLPNGSKYVHLAASDVWPELRRVLWVSLGPLVACGAVGLLVGAVARRGASALAGALGALAAIDLGRAIARPAGHEEWLLTSALPSPLGDRSAIGAYLDFSRGISNVSPPVAERPLLLAVAWILPCLLLAVWRFRRRTIA